MITRQDLIGYLRQLVERERQIKMTYYFLATQLSDKELRTLFEHLEAQKQRHEDDLEAIVTRLL